jgi:glycosyltransferase involved in cell wall biosynthesis
VTLGILYHMPFWRAADGTLWESEGSFARYVDALAPYFDEVVLCVPVFDRPQTGGSRVRAANVTLAPLPHFPGPRQFYPQLFSMLPRLRAWVRRCDVIHLRVPTPAAIFAFRIARKMRPIFLLVVGDYRALRSHLGYRGIKRALFAAYVAIEEWAVEFMAARALTFTNGAALHAKHDAAGRRVHQTTTSTLHLDDVAERTDALSGGRVRLFTVSRIDPRKGLRVLPAVVSALRATGSDARVDVVGPDTGHNGSIERDAILDDARRLNVEPYVTLRGAVPLDQLMRLYREFDVFVLPTKPGEGIPRVLLEAMANGLPVITTAVAGITSLITHEQNGLLVDGDSAGAIAAAIRRLVDDVELRRRLIANGYETARANTVQRQAEEMMRIVSSELGLVLHRRPAA